MTEQPSDLGKALTEVVEKTQLLVHEEIELAKAEVTDKVTKLIKGVAVGAAAGVFVVNAMLFVFHAVAWGIWDFENDISEDNQWLGYAIVATSLLALGAVAGWLAARFVKKGAPPTPDMAIEEAKKIKETYTG